MTRTGDEAGAGPEPDLGAGSGSEARAALEAHERAWACLPAGSEGRSGEWEWYRGSTRIAWRRLSGATIYKIETAQYSNANHTEHANARVLRDLGEAWAPGTRLFPATGTPAGLVLAMPYYPVAVRSPDEIPADALELAPDTFLSNFRRTAELPGGEVKIVDLGDVLPRLAQMAARIRTP